MKLLMCWVAFTNSMTNDRPEEWENSEKMIIKKTGVGLLIHGRWLFILRFHFFHFHLVLLKYIFL